MKTLLTLILALGLGLVLPTGCSVVGGVGDAYEGSLAFQWATARALRESDNLEAQRVLNFVERAREHTDNSEGTADVLIERIRGEVDWDGMYPEDRRLLEGIFAGAVQRLEERELPSGKLRMEVREILDAVETAALLASGE